MRGLGLVDGFTVFNKGALTPTALTSAFVDANNQSASPAAAVR